jgi:hypothetical protein
MFGVLKRVVKKAGKTVNRAGRAVKRTVKKARRAVGKLPVVGKPLQAATDIVLLNNAEFLGEVLDGKRIDRAAMGNVRATVKDVKDVAPYAKTVLTMVPGVGTAASAAIAAGFALAEGQPINEVILSGVRGALPGGEAVRVSFDIAVKVGKGKTLDKVAIESVPGLSEKERTALKEATTLARNLAKGKRIDEALYQSTMKVLPKNVRKAVQTGIALGKGASVQSQIRANMGNVAGQVAKVGLEKIKGKKKGEGDKELEAGSKDLTVEQQVGFSTATGLMLYQVAPIEVQAIRAQLSAEAKVGFDLAIAAHLGQGKKKAGNADADFATAVVNGGAHFSGGRLKKMVLELANQERKKSLVMAAEVKAEGEKTWLDYALEYLGLA